MPIFDQGYQHWKGELAGHAWRWFSISAHGVRNGMKNRWIRGLLILAWSPAICLTFFLSIWGMVEQKSELIMPLVRALPFLDPKMVADPISFRVPVWTVAFDFFLWIELYVCMILVLLVGPNLISQDLRFNAIPLYFSRPLRRIDYFLGKLGTIGFFLAFVVILPSCVAYLLGLCFSLDISLIRGTFHILVSAVAYGLVVVVSAGTLMLALSSLSRNSRYVILSWLGLWIVSAVTSLVLGQFQESDQRTRNYQRQAALSAQQPVPNPGPGVPPGHNPRAPNFAGPDAKAQAEAAEIALAEDLEIARSDWRPLLSYTANLARVGSVILDTDSAWKKFSEIRPPQDRERFLLEKMGPQYPWYWSGAVLAVLFGISVCILNFRVKSLDRLR